eukprot:7100973-Alexandrium_andersonii.AAC.1
MLCMLAPWPGPCTSLVATWPKDVSERWQSSVGFCWRRASAAKGLQCVASCMGVHVLALWRRLSAAK